MTTILSACRTTFAMLAADNLSSSRNDFGFDTRRFHRKLTVHSNLPIAIASSGLSHLNGTPTIERAIAALDGLPASPPKMDLVRQRLREALQQLVIEQLDHVPTQLQHIDHCVHLHIAIFGADGPECGGLFMTKTAEDREGGYLQMPDPLHPWFKEHQEIDWEGVTLLSAAELSKRVRDTFATVFQCDALLHDGVSLTVGGAIDIATVDADGATLFSMLPVEWPCSLLELPIPRRVTQMYAARGWSLEEMTDAEQPDPPFQREDNLRRVTLNPLLEDRLLVWLQEWSGQIGAELKDGLRENPSWIAFARESGTVYHTYTVSAPDPFVAPYYNFLLERTPKTQTAEPRTWRKDEYPD